MYFRSIPGRSKETHIGGEEANCGITATKVSADPTGAAAGMALRGLPISSTRVGPFQPLHWAVTGCSTKRQDRTFFGGGELPVKSFHGELGANHLPRSRRHGF